MKKKERIAEYRKMDNDALKAKIDDLQDELMKLRFRHASGQLEQTAQLKYIRRQIAQINTVISEMARQA